MQIREEADFPQPRAFHTSVLISTSIYLFGGQDSAGALLGMRSYRLE
jgi:hypothetical protein